MSCLLLPTPLDFGIEPAMKKKLPMNTLVTATPRHPISERDSVIKVVANAPMANSVYQCISPQEGIDSGFQCPPTGLPTCLLVAIGTGTACNVPFGPEKSPSALAVTAPSLPPCWSGLLEISATWQVW